MPSIPLAGGETATITMRKKMSLQSWQTLIDTLELREKQAGAAESRVADIRQSEFACYGA